MNPTPHPEPLTLTTLRVPTALLARLDALRPRLVAPGLPPATRSDALRLAIVRGVEALEGEHGRRPRARRTRT